MTNSQPANLLPSELTERILDLACEIQEIPAPTFHEGQRADFFSARFLAAGLKDVQTDPVGNVLARLPGSGTLHGISRTARPLVISAHMDTVHPSDTPLGVQRQGDRITGPGIGDNALGLAAVVGLAQHLKESGAELPGDLWLAINVGEEGLGDLRGIQAIVNRFRGSPLAYLVIEGMGLGTILNRGLGVERYKISVHTPGGHSWVDYGQPSAIHELCRIVTQLLEMTLPQTPCTTMNAGVIRGGTSVNTIAAHAWLELDLRSEDSGTLTGLVSEVHQIVTRANREGVSVQMERIGKRLAGHLQASHPLVVLAHNVLSEVGLNPHLDIASTDANLPLSRGYPAICVGITHGDNAHTLEEYILTAPVSQGLAQLYLLVTRAWDAMT